MKESGSDDAITVVAMPGKVTEPAPAECVVERPQLPSHDILAQLARDDPLAYEALRRQMVEGFINSAPERLKPRLRGLQFRVDSVRRLSRASALGATVRIYELMWKSFLQLNEVWQDFVPLENRQGARPATKYAPKKNARILAFRPRLPCGQ